MSMQDEFPNNSLVKLTRIKRIKYGLSEIRDSNTETVLSNTNGLLTFSADDNALSKTFRISYVGEACVLENVLESKLVAMPLATNGTLPKIYSQVVLIDGTTDSYDSDNYCILFDLVPFTSSTLGYTIYRLRPSFTSAQRTTVRTNNPGVTSDVLSASTNKFVSSNADQYSDNYTYAFDGNNFTIAALGIAYGENCNVYFKFDFVNPIDETREVPAFVENPINRAISSPGTVSAGYVNIRYSGLDYDPNYPNNPSREFQYRFKEEGTDTWINARDGNTYDDGWGPVDLGSHTYVDSAENADGLIFSHSMRNLSTELSVDNSKKTFLLNVRALVADQRGIYNSNLIPTAYSETVVNMFLEPGLTIDSCLFSIDTTKDSAKITTNMLPYGNVSGIQYIKLRLVGEDGEYISDYVTSTSTTIEHCVSDNVLYRLPTDNERITVQYILITSEGLSYTGLLDYTFSYEALTNDPTITYEDDGANSVIVESDTHDDDLCYLMVKNYEHKIKMVKCPVVVKGTQKTSWRALPCLNRDSEIIVVSKVGSSYGYSMVTARIDSHNFIWNWSKFKSTEPYDEFAIVIVNSDNPPQQTRSFKTDAQFISPVGRTFPVSFATTNLDTTLNVEGVVIDKDADYYAPEPLPAHSTIEYVSKLVRLSGLGIHPIYRTPYGDWYQVAIEQVDLSKTELNKSNVSVSQRAVED